MDWRAKMELNRDFSDLLSAFNARKVRFLLVGAYALSFYGRPRTTGDLDLWIDSTVSNARRVFDALADFGAPLGALSPSDFATPGTVFQIGVAPRRIDILTSVTGLKFEAAWRGRRRAAYGKIPIQLLSERDFVTNKRALGRTRDLADAEEIEAILKRRKGRRG
jgi:hypothetical protein